MGLGGFEPPISWALDLTTPGSQATRPFQTIGLHGLLDQIGRTRFFADGSSSRQPLNRAGQVLLVNNPFHKAKTKRRKRAEAPLESPLSGFYFVSTSRSSLGCRILIATTANSPAAAAPPATRYSVGIPPPITPMLGSCTSVPWKYG